MKIFFSPAYCLELRAVEVTNVTLVACEIKGGVVLAKVSKETKQELTDQIATAINENPDSGLCKRLVKIATKHYVQAIGWGYKHPRAVEHVVSLTTAYVRTA